VALSREGAFWPNPKGTGLVDGGFDARFVGSYGGVDERWRVSSKHTVAKDPVKGLKKLLATDFARYPDEAWFVVTNATLDPPTQDRLREWCRTQCSPSAPCTSTMATSSGV
jgi:hypothetical protein